MDVDVGLDDQDTEFRFTVRRSSRRLPVCGFGIAEEVATYYVFEPDLRFGK